MTVTVGTATAAFPLHTEAGKRYLVDANGQPFLIKGDSPWCLITQLNHANLDTYLNDRRAKGFNTLLVELVEHSLCANAPRDIFGNAPFTVAGDFGTPNEAYFANAAYVIGQAQAKGFLILLTPTYMGFNGNDSGWYSQMQANGETKMRAFGRYVATRFASYHNILWVQGGDYNPPEKVLLRAVANGIRDVAPSTLQSFHGARQTSALAFLGTTEAWLTVNDIYASDATVVSTAFTEYARSSMPFFLIEAYYENEHSVGEQLVRTQAYQAVLSGASGHVAGNNPLWGFFTGWQTALNSGGSRTLAHLHSLFGSLAWWTLVPDTGNTLLTSGVSTGSSRAVAARSSTGSTAVVYTPSVRSMNIALSRLSGPHVRARWYDPTNGTYATVSGSPFAASGTTAFTPTGANAGGFGDWVLVLDSVP
jgi:hypothetical protein